MFRYLKVDWSRFYKTDVRLFEIQKSGGYSRDTAITNELGSIKADLQPYGGELAREHYGVSVECQMQMFCEHCEAVKVGSYAEADGVRYRIVYVASWDCGLEVLLNKE